MKYIAISILSFFIMNVAFAQTASHKQKLQDAEYFFLNEDYEQAMLLFKEIVKEDPSNANANYKIGLCYQRLPFEAGRSIPYLKKSITDLTKSYVEGSVTEKKAPIHAMYSLAFAYHTNKYYSEALDLYQRYMDTLAASDKFYRSVAERQMQSCINAQEIARNPVPVEIFNIGNIINTGHDEYNPCPTADGKHLFFTRVEEHRIVTKKGDDDAVTRVYKIMYSQYLGNDRWSKPEDISAQLKTKNVCNTVSINHDGTFLILFKNTWENGGMIDFASGTLYYSTRKSIDDTWSPIKKFNRHINSIGNETHAMLSPDGEKLYVTSDRKGGYGGLDIYVSKKVKGDWGPLQNLGPIINTPYDEQTPIISEDGKTLYFSSEGHFNMGGLDIFKTSILSDGSWAEPTNIGAPINSPENNAYFFPVLNGKQAFYALARHEGYFTFGASDIYQLEFLENIDAHSVPITLQGMVLFDDDRPSDITTQVAIVNLKTKDTVQLISPNERGEYTTKVSAGEYKIAFTREGYNDTEKQIIIAPTTVEKTVNINTLMYPLAVNSKKYYVIRNIYFDLDSYELNKDAEVEANKLLTIMIDNPSLYIEVMGHTDSYGTEAYNQKLSGQRSRTVIEFLIKKGVEPERFVSTALGTTQKAVEDTKNGEVDAEKAQLNRRVEIRILKSKGDAEIVVDNRPDEIKFKKYNRFSILLAESAERMQRTEFATVVNSAQVMEFLTKQGKYYYYYGDFTSKAEASKALNEAIDKGFSHARLIDYFALNSANEFVITNPVKYTKKYTIQLQALSRPVILHANPIMSETTRYRTKDGYYRYTFKEYDDLKEAELDLQKVIDNGFTDAVIVDVTKLID